MRRETGEKLMPSVPSAELLRHFGRYRDIAQREPVTISSRGRDALVLMSTEEYRRLKRRDRQVLLPEDFDDEMLRALEAAKMSPEHDHLNDLLPEDWKP